MTGPPTGGPWPDVGRFLLVPGEVTRVPGTNCELLWHGDRPVTVYRRDGLWDLSPLLRPGRVLVWERLVHRPQLGWWPVLPLTSRNTYRARPAGSPSAGDGTGLRRGHARGSAGEAGGAGPVS